MSWMRCTLGLAAVFVTAVLAQAQVPDLVSQFQAGAKAMGEGGASAITDTNTLSPINNPATLALADRREFGFSMRNLPSSFTTETGGTIGNPGRSSSADKGTYGFSHIGAIFPIKDGAFGLSYSIAGYVDDTEVGDLIADGNLVDRNLTGSIKEQTNFLTLAVGKNYQNYNFGYGLVVAQTSVHAGQSYVQVNGANTQVGAVNTTANGTEYGLGLIVGYQTVPPEGKNVTWGASLRTPITLKGNQEASQIVSIVPGQLSVGVTQRPQGMGESADFLMLSGRADYQFGGSGTDVIDRRNVLGLSVGGEYNVIRDDVRLPLRIGYSFAPASGSFFADRSAITFGVGYKNRRMDYAFDLSVAKPTNGGASDLALSVTYRPKEK